MPITIKHKSTFLYGITLLAGATMMTGCAADPITVPGSEQYNRDFIKTIGTFDPNHDWNHAAQTTVNVTTTKATDVKVYAMVNNVRYLFGTYLGVEGRQTLNVDVPKGTTDLIVRANDNDYQVKAGGSLTLSGRAGETTTPTMTCKLADRQYWKQFSVDEVLGYREMLPEKIVNYDKVIDNFTFTPRHDFIIYPVYYQTSQNNEVGLYYEKEDGSIEHMPIYLAQSNAVINGEGSTSSDIRDLILQKSSSYDWIVIEDSKTDFTAADFDSEAYRLSWMNKNPVDQGNETLLTYLRKPGEWANALLSDEKLAELNGEDKVTVNGQERERKDVYPIAIKMNWASVAGSTSSYDEGCPYWRSKGVAVSLTPGVKYGFYIKHPNDGYFYSETRRNEVNTGLNFNESGTLTAEQVQALKDKYVGKHAAHFGVYEADGPNGEKRFVVGGEDWKAGDSDLNDVVFYIENFDPEEEWPPIDVVDKDIVDVPYTWVIACEDLGTNDFDFNDVVFGVGNYTANAEGTAATVDVTALAAGGTLPVYLHHGGNRIVPEGNTSNGEFHSWFGSTNSAQIINARTYSGPGATVTIPVEVGFTMQCCQTVTNDGGSGNMGGFQVEVKYPDKVEVIEATNPKAAAAHPDLGKPIGDAPQMICVPNTWLWPVENMMITNVYSAFTDWAQNPDTNKDWHDTRNGSAGSHFVYREITLPDNPDNPDNPDDNTKILSGKSLGHLYNNKSMFGFEFTISSDVLDTAKEIAVTVKVDGVVIKNVQGEDVTVDIYRADGTTSNNIKYDGNAFKGNSLTNLIGDNGVFRIHLYRAVEFEEAPSIEVSIKATLE